MSPLITMEQHIYYAPVMMSPPSAPPGGRPSNDLVLAVATGLITAGLGLMLGAPVLIAAGTFLLVSGWG